MKNRASSHLLVHPADLPFRDRRLLAIHRGGVLRGYATSTIGAVRDLLCLFVVAMVIWLSAHDELRRAMDSVTAAVLLFLESVC